MSESAQKEKNLELLKGAISSIDDIIVLQTEKLELLKQHRLGLMQLQSEITDDKEDICKSL